MAYSIFVDKAHVPEPAELAAALGPAQTLWDDLKQRLAARFAPLTEEWTHGGKNYGWSFRLKQKKRAILYLTPAEGYFRVGLVLGEKVVQAALAGDLPAATKTLLETAPKYPEGRGFRLEVRQPADLPLILQLADIKMAH